ncbi:hypothetical protein EXE48_12150 [Halorubrum sp. ASP1]|uniref:hypothetical protein n=1 Tax=Halorubrum sp. ASP1 TaxID=2518114 RepID=UPI0010F61086|nr:hypothetical protein [Halorubrum sp. ASP1]TKX60717.1 hypothetical protein EXE48_12150 [Halorubrum sp. ASP1]
MGVSEVSVPFGGETLVSGRGQTMLPCVGRLVPEVAIARAQKKRPAGWISSPSDVDIPEAAVGAVHFVVGSPLFVRGDLKLCVAVGTREIETADRRRCCS